MVQTPTLRQLEYLVAVADRGGFHRAARACGVSQPGLSAQIRQLEGLLDLCLLERDHRRVRLTAAGEEIARRARAVLAETRGLVEAARSLQRPLCGPLRIGVIPTVAPYLLPHALPRVRRRHPELRLGLVEATTAELVAALGRGDLDLLLLALEASLDGLATRVLFRDPFHVALPPAIGSPAAAACARRTWPTSPCCCSRTATACGRRCSRCAAQAARASSATSARPASRRWSSWCAAVPV